MKRLAFPLAAMLAVLAGPAHAHTFGVHAAGFAHGLFHPLGGLDHLLAMLGVGIFAWQSGGRALWLLPVAFLLAMAGGGAIAFAGLDLPGVELGIAASVLLVGFLIALAPRLPVLVIAALIALFAICHGFAHGVEAADAAAPLGYMAGFVLASALLHAGGIGLAALASRLLGAAAFRLSGLGLAASGVVLLAG